MKLNERELYAICGGASASLINAVVKGISLLVELGKSLGSIVKKITVGKSCEM